MAQAGGIKDEKVKETARLLKSVEDSETLREVPNDTKLEFNTEVELENKSQSPNAQQLAPAKAGLVWMEEEDLVIDDVLDPEAEAKHQNYFTSGWVTIVTFKGKPTERWYCKGALDEDMQQWLNQKDKIAKPEVRQKIAAILKRKQEKREAAAAQAKKDGKPYQDLFGEIGMHMAAREAYVGNNIFRLYLPETQPEIRLVTIPQKIKDAKFYSYLVLSREVVGFTPLISMNLAEWKQKIKAGKVKNLGLLVMLSMAANEVDLNTRNIGYIVRGDEWILVRIDFGCCFAATTQQFSENHRKHMRFHKTAQSIDAAPFLATVEEKDQPRYEMYTSFDIQVKGHHLKSKLFDVTILDALEMIGGKHLAILFLILTTDSVVDAYAVNYPIVPETPESVERTSFSKTDKAIKKDFRKIAAEIVGFTKFYFQAAHQYFSTNEGPIAELKKLLQDHVGDKPLVGFDNHIKDISKTFTDLPALVPAKKENKEDDDLEALLKQVQELDAEVQREVAAEAFNQGNANVELSRVALVAQQESPERLLAQLSVQQQIQEPDLTCREACALCCTMEFWKNLLCGDSSAAPGAPAQQPAQQQQQPPQLRL